jgi:hypothetical protein
MTEESSSDDQLFGAIDLIINVLKEHENNLDDFVDKLEKITERIKKTGEVSGRIDKIEEQIGNLRNQISIFQNALQSSQAQVLPKESTLIITEQKLGSSPPPVTTPLPSKPNRLVILHCRQWGDFQTLALDAENLSFSYNEVERTFRADALKGDKIVNYSGELPQLSSPLKCWLSKQFNVPESKILEGVLSFNLLEKKP